MAERQHIRGALERMLFFSDAVFAIAITLLAIEIKVPELGHAATSEDLASALIHLIPLFIGFVVSFALIGQTWTEHHRIGEMLRGVNLGLLWWNLLLLFFIVLMPFVTGLVSEASRPGLPVLLYAIVFAGVGFAKAFLWLHAVRTGLIDRPLDAEARSIGLRVWSMPIVATIVGAISLTGVRGAMWGFFLVPLIAWLLHLLSARKPRVPKAA